MFTSEFEAVLELRYFPWLLSQIYIVAWDFSWFLLFEYAEISGQNSPKCGLPRRNDKKILINYHNYFYKFLIVWAVKLTRCTLLHYVKALSALDSTNNSTTEKNKYIFICQAGFLYLRSRCARSGIEYRCLILLQWTYCVIKLASLVE